MLQLFAPAKINLGLQIIGKRNDGYHNIHSLFFPIKSIADILTIELAQSLTLICSKELDIPMYIGNKEVRSENKIRLSPPHDHKHTLGHFHKSDKIHVEQAINAGLLSN